MNDKTSSRAAKIEALFNDPDPALHRNKQLVFHFLRDLAQAGHWEKADQYISERYIQHNPLAESGRQAIIDFFTKTLSLPRQEEITPLETPTTAVIAQGDFVVILMPCRYPDPNKPGETYETTWFDCWRIVDGKLDEHWDGQRLFPGMTPTEMALASWSPADDVD